MNKYEEDILEVPKEIQKEVLLAKFKMIRRDYLTINDGKGNILLINQILKTRTPKVWRKSDYSLIDKIGIIALFIDLELNWVSTVEGMEYWRQKFNTFVKNERHKR